MIRVTHTKAQDYIAVQPDITVWTSDPIHVVAERIEELGTFRTFWRDGKVLAVAGFLHLRPGVAEVTSVFAPGWVRYRKGMCRKLRTYLEIPQAMYNRVQATCLADPRYLRFAEFFGFVPEGVLRCYDRHGRDHLMLSWIKGGCDG